MGGLILLALIVYAFVRMAWAVVVAAVVAAFFVFMFLAYGIAKGVVWLRAS